MFYSVFVLGKKGPLARVWLAAHWDKKITKAQILETNIVESVDSILQPKVKLSLRTSSHLLLGIVRIYARKAAYLLQDCQDAAFKIKSAFRPGVVDLPDGKTEAAISAITLPDNFDFINDFDLIAEPTLHMEPTTTANLRNITLLDDVSSINLDDPLMMNDHRDWSEIGSIGHGSINIRDTSDSGTERNLAVDDSFDMFHRPAMDDGFGGSLSAGIMDEDVFGMTMPSQEEMNKDENGFNGDRDDDRLSDGLKNGEISRPGSAMSAHSDAMSYGGPASVAPSGPPSTPGSPNALDDVEPFNTIMDHTSAMDNRSIMTDDLASTHNDINGAEPNTMVLEPIDSQLGGMLERKRKRRKKIGMAIDEMKTLSGEEMKAQLSDTSDIVTNLDLAPPNKILMNWKKTGLVDKLFSLPQRTIPCKALSEYYSTNLITTRYEAANELDDDEALLLNNDAFEDEYNASINGARYQDTIGASHQILPELDDLEQDFMQNSIEFAVPKTPRAAKSPTPQRKKRKTEDKENQKDAGESKRSRDSKFEKINSFDRPDSMQYSDSMHNSLQDISSIQEARGGSSADARGSSMMQFSNMEPLIEDFDKDDDDDDGYAYDGNGPMSVEPPEEMLPEETFDQFVERVQTKRSTHLLKRMAHQLEELDHINFSSISKNNNRKMAAQNFYGLLVLKKQMAVELYQNPEVPYADIMIKKGFKFEEQLVATA